jgi:hypothetical protein
MHISIDAFFISKNKEQICIYGEAVTEKRTKKEDY